MKKLSFIFVISLLSLNVAFAGAIGSNDHTKCGAVVEDQQVKTLDQIHQETIDSETKQ